MEEKKNEAYGHKIFRCFASGSFGTFNYRVIFYSFFAIFAFGIVSNSIGHYLGIEYNVGLFAAAFLLFMLVARMKFANRYVYYCAFNLSLSILVGALFFVLREKIQNYIIILITLIVIYTFVALVLAKDTTIKNEDKISNLKELIEVCVRSEGFGLILILSLWLIFFVMLQSFFWATESSMSTAALALPEGAIVSFLFSWVIISIAMILSTRKVKKRLSTILLFFILSAISVLFWIVASSIIFAIELRLV